jgi:hypothetical protein
MLYDDNNNQIDDDNKICYKSLAFPKLMLTKLKTSSFSQVTGLDITHSYLSLVAKK